MDGIDFKVSEGLIKPIIETKIKMAIAEAMGGHEQLLDHLIEAFMRQKVDSSGNVDDRGYSGSKPRIDYLITKMMETAMKSAIEEYLAENLEIVRDAIVRYFKTKQGSARIITAIQEGLCKSFADKWLTKIEFNMQPRER